MRLFDLIIKYLLIIICATCVSSYIYTNTFASTPTPGQSMTVIPRDGGNSPTATPALPVVPAGTTVAPVGTVPGTTISGITATPAQSSAVPGTVATPVPSTDAVITPAVPAVPTLSPNVGNNNFSKTSSKNTPCDVILILGDSRACSLIKALWDNDNYESLYYYADRTNAIDAICKRDNRIIVICAEPGGSLQSGAVTRATNRMLNLLNNNVNIRNQKSYTFFNMFGLNDCLLDKASAKSYIPYDTSLIGTLPNCTHVYQLNAGPVCMNANPVPDDEANAIISKYNADYQSTSAVTVVDLYGFLMTSGYHTEFSQIDVSGLHYDAETNVRIMNFILGVAYEAVLSASPVNTGIPAMTNVPIATPSVIKPAVSVPAGSLSPVVSTAAVSSYTTSGTPSVKSIFPTATANP
ncbi:MAG: hypothetical protein K5888_03335 [Lachnospiraceae bacterium]|nr:hypothetical protein [Lachnospiraceae bacterium]